MNNYDNELLNKIMATFLNIKMYYGTLAVAEGREDQYHTAMYMMDDAGNKKYMSSIKPQAIAAMGDNNSILFVTTTYNKPTYRKYRMAHITPEHFSVTFEKFLNDASLEKRAIATNTQHIYNMLYHSAKKIKEAEDAYYDELAKQAEAEEAYRAMCAYGPCHDTAWQQGINI